MVHAHLVAGKVVAFLLLFEHKRRDGPTRAAERTQAWAARTRTQEVRRDACCAGGRRNDFALVQLQLLLGAQGVGVRVRVLLWCGWGVRVGVRGRGRGCGARRRRAAGGQQRELQIRRRLGGAATRRLLH